MFQTLKYNFSRWTWSSGLTLSRSLTEYLGIRWLIKGGCLVRSHGSADGCICLCFMAKSGAIRLKRWRRLLWHVCAQKVIGRKLHMEAPSPLANTATSSSYFCPSFSFQQPHSHGQTQPSGRSSLVFRCLRHGNCFGLRSPAQKQASMSRSKCRVVALTRCL